ncbi:MAG: NAD(P)H-hydrate epimerase, partial [Bacteroidota bacterium]
MIKILNSAQIRELDKITIKSQGITSLELMERAAEACVNHLLNIITTSHEYIYVVCGKGNNGGDGLAIARILYSKKVFPQIKIIVIVIDENNSETRDFKEN